MYIITNIGLRDQGCTGGILHGDFNLQFGKGATILIEHDILRNMIGHLIPPGVAQQYVKTNLAESISGVLLFLS